VGAGRGPGQGGIRGLPQSAVSDLEAAVAARDRLGGVDASPQPGKLFRQERLWIGRLGWALIGVRPDGCGELGHGALELHRKGEREMRLVWPGSPPRGGNLVQCSRDAGQVRQQELDVVTTGHLWVTDLAHRVSPSSRSPRVPRYGVDIYTGATRQVRLKPAPKVVKNEHRCGIRALCQWGLMAPLPATGATYRPAPPRQNGTWYCWPIAASCMPMLVGVVVLVVAHRAGLTFLTLFLWCTTLMVALMVWLGHTPHEPAGPRRRRRMMRPGRPGEGELVRQHLEPVGRV